jgi:hypothetical protein
MEVDISKVNLPFFYFPSFRFLLLAHCPPFPPFTFYFLPSHFFNHESAQINTNKMPIKAEREVSGAPECQRRETSAALAGRLLEASDTARSARNDHSG